MMKKVLFLTFMALVITLPSCNNDSDNSIVKNDADAFIEAFNGNIDDFLNREIIDTEPQQIQGFDHSSSKSKGYTPVYIDSELSDTALTKLFFSNIKTARQIMDLVTKYGLSMSMEDDGTYDTVLLLSDSEAKESLKQLVKASKQYLRSKGFTNKDINDMLSENSADETQLVPFVMALAEIEKYQEDNPYIDYPFADNNSSNNPYGVAPGPQKITWKQVGNCAMEAIGFDILASLAHSSAKTWSIAMIKRVFKTAAKRLIGPVGVAIAVIEFGICIMK